jgi:SsrA-binding protein
LPAIKKPILTILSSKNTKLYCFVWSRSQIIRSGAARLTGAFVTFHEDTAMLTNAFIPPYKHASHLENYIPDASRKLLLKKREIDYLRGKLQQKGLTIVPLSLYTKGQFIKVEIGLAQGKKTFDKRQTIKEREGKREIARKIKNQ